MAASPLLDVHQLGLGETGNETWARNIVAALEGDGGPRVDYAVTAAGAQQLVVEPSRRHEVSGSSARRLAWELPLLVRRTRPSVLLVQYTLPPILKVPGVVVVHDVSFVHDAAKGWIPPRSLLRYRLTIGSSIRRARVVVVPSKHTRDEVLEHYDRSPDDVLVAPLALDPELSAQLGRARERARTMTVLCVGTVLPRKNLTVVARAVAALRAGGLPVRLRLVGPLRGAGRAELAAMAALLGDALDVVGPVTLAALAEEYAAAGVLAFPSLYEGFGLPVLEAMAAGLPVVSSSATSLPEVAGEAALLVDPADVEGWVAALTQVLVDPEAASTLADRGKARIGDFTWQETGAAVRCALQQAVG